MDSSQAAAEKGNRLTSQKLRNQLRSETMEYRRLGRTGLNVSELCLGTMQFGWTADHPTSFAIMDAFVAAGGTFIDTADVYTWWAGDASYAGHTEEIIGKWLDGRTDRQEIILATKLGGPMAPGPNNKGLSRKRVLECCDASLRRLRTDYIDLYQCHLADTHTPIEETLSALDDLVRAGKVRYIGASNYPAWRLMEALAVSDKRQLARFESYQPIYSLADRKLFEVEPRVLCRNHNIGVIPYSPLAAGFLTGKYRKHSEGNLPESARASEIHKAYMNDCGWAVLEALESVATENGKSMAQTALAWLLTNPIVTAPIIGANTVAQLNESLGAVGYRLSSGQMEKLTTASDYPRPPRDIWD